MSSTLLHQIQTEAIDGTTNLASLLRKCRLLAQRIGNEDFKAWVSSELEGYPFDGIIPSYRKHRHPMILGQYSGIGGSGAENVRIPRSAFPDQLRDRWYPVHFHQGIAELENLAGDGKGHFEISVPPEIYPMINYSGVRRDFVLVQLKKTVSRGFVIGILDSVRNRLLNFTLELEEFAPLAGEVLPEGKDIPAEKVQQTFNTNIWGGVSNFNQAGNNVTQTVVTVGDVESVKRVLEEAGFPAPEVENLAEALTSEKQEPGGGWGPRVAASAGKLLQKAGEGALKIPGSVAANLIAEVIKNYNGG